MKKLDFRSVIIGFLMAVIFFLITGQSTNNTSAEFEYIKANRMPARQRSLSGLQQAVKVPYFYLIITVCRYARCWVKNKKRKLNK